MRRWPHLDGVRGVAALLVLLTHLGFWTGTSGAGALGAVLARGDAGVAVFFALSAFLLAGPWLSWAGPSAPSVRGYAVHRAARILPGYAVALGAVLALAAAGVVARSGFPAADERAAGVGGPAKVLTHLVLGQGLTGDLYQAFSQTWSLTSEVLFYLVLPALALGLRRLGPRGRVGAVTALGVLGLGAQSLAAVGAPAWVVLSPIGHAAWFAAGLGVRLALDARGNCARPGVALGLAAAAYLVAATPLGGPRLLASPTVVEAVTKEALYAAFAAALVWAGVGASTGGVSVRWLGTAPVRWVGEVSYGVFLWHLVVLQVLYAGLDLRLFRGHLWPVLAATVTLTLALAWLSWRTVESPVLAWARSARRGGRR